MKNYKILFYILLNSCIPQEGPKCHKSIDFINNSSKDIWVHKSDKNGRVTECNSVITKVLANSKKDRAVIQSLKGNCFEKYINSSFRGGKLDVYIYSDQPNSLIDCDTLKLKSYLIEMRSLTVDELQKSNWVITYPK
jgi:hypothetical protein